MKTLMVVMAAAAITLAVQLNAAGEVRAQTTAAGNLAGTWQLVSRVDRTASGEVVQEPELGSDPVALLIYDRAGHVAVQLMKRNRAGTPGSAAPTPAAAGEVNDSGAVGGYDAYFGTYEVDLEKGVVTHTLEAALVATDVGKRLSRHFRVVGDELEIWFSMTATSGRTITRTLKWKRVG